MSIARTSYQTEAVGLSIRQALAQQQFREREKRGKVAKYSHKSYFINELRQKVLCQRNCYLGKVLAAQKPFHPPPRGALIVMHRVGILVPWSPLSI